MSPILADNWYPLFFFYWRVPTRSPMPLRIKVVATQIKSDFRHDPVPLLLRISVMKERQVDVHLSYLEHLDYNVICGDGDRPAAVLVLDAQTTRTGTRAGGEGPDVD